MNGNGLLFKDLYYLLVNRLEYSHRKNQQNHEVFENPQYDSVILVRESNDNDPIDSGTWVGIQNNLIGKNVVTEETLQSLITFTQDLKQNLRTTQKAGNSSQGNNYYKELISAAKNLTHISANVTARQLNHEVVSLKKKWKSGPTIPTLRKNQLTKAFMYYVKLSIRQAGSKTSKKRVANKGRGSHLNPHPIN